VGILVKRLRTGLLASLALFLSGCDTVLLSPSGDIAAQQRDLLVVSTGLMLIIILPVMALTAIFAFRYRQANRAAKYEPEWDHSTHLELIIWGAPLLIIICLGALTWMGSHLLDPYRPIERITADTPLEEGVETLEIGVVALDWKWLFFYPQYGIASVNDIAVPVDRPIRFRITSASVMNSFFIPALAGQIYAMPGMETKLHAVINESGDFEGFSANYSGAGFSGMDFTFHGMEAEGFDSWVEKVRESGKSLDRQTYLDLEKPSENVPPIHYGSTQPNLFDAIVNMCVEPGKLCMREIKQRNAAHGDDEQEAAHPDALRYDKDMRRGGPAAPHGGEETEAHGAALEPGLPDELIDPADHTGHTGD
jgi:cytochrome o ubiquinol oxidase subunit II